MVTDVRDQTARDRAVTRLKKRRDFRGHLLVYVLVNTFIAVVC
jgi:2TM domain